jgi:cohesin complex subunit SCC1
MYDNHIASPLTPAPQTPRDDVDLTPQAAASETAKAKRKPKEKKQIIDAVTELEDGPGAKAGRGRNAGLGAPMTKDVSGILTEHHFLPRSSLVMRLLEIRSDPLAHFLPVKVTPHGTYFCAGPPGLAPELSEMFMRPVNNAFSHKRRGASPGRGPNKKPRLDVDDDVEQGVRAGSAAPSIGLGSDVLGRGSMGPDGGFDFGDHTGMGMDDFQMDVGGDMERGKSAGLTDLSRLSTPMADGIPLDDGEETYADLACPIATFDLRPSQSQTAEKEAEAIDNEGKGYSKNTVKALTIIRKELQPAVEEEAGDKVLSFRKMSDKVWCRGCPFPLRIN